jgi:hypothetical protein
MTFKINLISLQASFWTPSKRGQVQPGAAAALINHDKGLSLTFGAHGLGQSGGIGVDTSRFNEWNYNAGVKEANQPTRDFVTAWLGASEAISQLPRLQTFGKSNRMTEAQMIAAQKLLPQPGDAEMATQKMTSLQCMIDPLRKQVPHMPGAEQMPSWLEQRRQSQAASGGSNLGNAVTMGNTDFLNRLQPTQ